MSDEEGGGSLFDGQTLDRRDRRRDLEAVVAFFDPRYEDEAPARQGKHVRGDDQVRENFVRLHRDLAELRAELLDCPDGAGRR